MLRAISDSLVSLLYPQPCGGCSDIAGRFSDGVACSSCWEKTRIFTGNETLCSKCGTYLRDGNNASEALCRHCDDHHYDRARAAGIYENALAAEVVRLKSTPSLSKRSATLFTAAFDSSGFDDATLVMPVPLSKRRFLERGFNQAALLARLIAKRGGIPTDEKSLVRKVHTPIHRAAMDRKARDLTVKNAFAVMRPASIEGQNIVLVDDVLTSGATVSYCAKILKKNGAGKVYVFTLARAV
jgi:ComF family protein